MLTLQHAFSASGVTLARTRNLYSQKLTVGVTKNILESEDNNININNIVQVLNRKHINRQLNALPIKPP